MTDVLNKNFNKVCDILEKYGNDHYKLIPILQEIQEIYSYLPEEIMTYIATALKISPAQIYGVATFYSHFTLNSKGKHIIKICDGTACHVKKSEGILNALRETLNLTGKKTTSDDGLFTLETVACLGACGLAPVVVIDEKVYGTMTPEKTLKLLDEIRKQEADNGNN
ncbi:MAG TPA: NADH-quinone oxidoreductase subunit NuoE [Thermotogota bacterium]|nr:NADH-quinone oxidoreductase subunit NuoE [Thermotogota bacterium]HPJ88323.1 NADH-quinone oxidoreductase subunit NuoE [Thermotogota bacterium]HPR95329.1 NADH-quinone oxidoreductase subunit NuoE [Thermotogota bacterium]